MLKTAVASKYSNYALDCWADTPSKSLTLIFGIRIHSLIWAWSVVDVIWTFLLLQYMFMQVYDIK